MEENTVTTTKRRTSRPQPHARQPAQREFASLVRLFDRLPARDRLEMVLLARMKAQLSYWEQNDDPAPNSVFD